jgi:hypothetical protein
MIEAGRFSNNQIAAASHTTDRAIRRMPQRKGLWANVGAETTNGGDSP